MESVDQESELPSPTRGLLEERPGAPYGNAQEEDNTVIPSQPWFSFSICFKGIFYMMLWGDKVDTGYTITKMYQHRLYLNKTSSHQ